MSVRRHTAWPHLVDESSHVRKLCCSLLEYLQVGSCQDDKPLLPGAEDLVLLYPHETFLYDVSVFLLKTQPRLEQLQLIGCPRLGLFLRTVESNRNSAPPSRDTVIFCLR